MDVAQNYKAECESADELADADPDWKSDDELDLPDKEMDKDMIIDDNDMSTEGGTSSYETLNKKAKKDVVNLNDNDTNIEQGTSSCGTSKTRPKRTKRTRVDPNEIVGDYWTPEEKSHLLVSMKHYGMLNIPRLAAILETKNVRQIKDFIAKVSKSCNGQLKYAATKRARKRLLQVSKNEIKTPKARKLKLSQLLNQEIGDGPINWWLRYMEKTMDETSKEFKKSDNALNPRKISELIPRACLLIAQYEDHPDPSSCGGVDFKEAYECLYHVLSGVPPKVLSRPTAVFIQRSIDLLRNSVLDGMYSPDYCKAFGEQVSHIMTTSNQTRPTPKRTYGTNKTASKNSGPVMTQGSGLPSPSQSFQGLMETDGFNPMKLPKTLSWRKGQGPPADKPVLRQKQLVTEDIPFGIFSGPDIY